MPWRSVDNLMKAAVAAGVFPGGVLLAAVGDDILFHGAYGLADTETGGTVSKDTVFDLASLTKPLATTLAVMKMVQEHIVSLDDELTSVLPAFQDTPLARASIRHLLDHSSGLEAYRPYFHQVANLPREWRRDALRRLLTLEHPLASPGRQTLYSDLGFMILEWAVEEITGLGLDRFVQVNFYEPLGLDRLFFVNLGAPPPKAEFAATERCPWRGRVLAGEVHDENAWICGGVQGHAGLFGTARDVHRLLCRLLDGYMEKNDFCGISKNWIRRFLSRTDLGERTLGFDVPSAMGSSCGRHFSADTVGHLGFTGTSFWMDLNSGRMVVLLTNRIHPNRANEQIRTFRPRIHDAVMAAMAGAGADTRNDDRQ